MDGKDQISYEDWIDENQVEIDMEIAESGADREMGFDREKEYLRRYDAYVSSIPEATWKSEE